MKKIALFALFSILSTQGLAADGLVGGKKTEYDRRVEAALKESNLNYTIDKDGDFRLRFNFDQNRSQVVFVQSRTETYKNYEIREIFSYAYKTQSRLFTADVANTLLKDNNAKKLGAWEKRGDYAVFVIKISGDADALSLQNAVSLAAVCSEDMELQLNPGKDDF
ncbi:MAG: hypothetical protein LWW75_11160 [Chlorobiales bacterium]|nr:hypothetical protein [Chlorobiales bacterium]